MSKSSTLPEGLKWSNYTLLKQIPLTNEYMANDDGVFVIEYNKKSDSYEKRLICEAISISMVNKDRNTEEEITEVQFIDYSTGKPVVSSKQIPTNLLASESGMSELAGAGFTIGNPMGYKKFIMSVKVNLNTLTRKGIKNANTKRFYGSRRYGFEMINGEINYDNFIGIDSPKIPDSAFADLEKTLFAPKGTLEKQKEFLDWVSKDSKCEVIYKQIIAMALAGITKYYVGKSVDNPVAEIIAPSSAGKGFLDHIIQTVWGKISDEKGISVSSKSSDAGLAPLKDVLYCLPIIISDITDKIKRDGVQATGLWCYDHTNSINTIKAQSDRRVSKFNYAWRNFMIMMAEKEDLMQEKDGVTSRIVHLQTGLRRTTGTCQGDKVSERDFSEIDKKQHENYGIIGPLFVKGIREYFKGHSIHLEFNNLVKDYEKVLKTTSKNAAIYALIHYTYNLAFEFGLLPERWGKMTIKENLSNYDKASEISSDEEMYNLIRDRVLTQTSVYIPVETKLLQGQYEEREKNNQAVRGRVAIKEINGHQCKIAIIPKDIFNQNIYDLEKKHDIKNFKVNPKNWIENGWLIAGSKGRADHDGTNITREYDYKNEMKRTKEHCYWLVLQDLDTFETEEDFNEYVKDFEEKADEYHKKIEEDRTKMKELKERLIPQTVNMITIPSGELVNE